MTGAELLLLVNIVMTALFAACFVAVAVMTEQQRVLWFAGAYGVGTLTPLSEFLLPLAPAPSILAFTSYASFLGGPLLIPIGLAAIHGRPRPWTAFWIILGGGIAARLAIWGGDRNSPAYQLAYQLPFALGALLACRTVLKVGERRPPRIAAAVLFALIALQFLAKALLVVALGSGRTAEDYTHSPYAVISQASTAVLLVAAGLIVLLIAVQKAIGDARTASETDPLSEVANRRGFDRRAGALLAQAARDGTPLSAVLFDLDHFKAVNDTFGHVVGDAVIASFGTLLRRRAPARSVVGRTGGEEFVMLLPDADHDQAARIAETVREALHDAVDGPLPPVTVSGGVAQWEAGESLVDLMRRADAASYRAKAAGRNRVCRDPARSQGPVATATAGAADAAPAREDPSLSAREPDEARRPAWTPRPNSASA